jgi:hypothetical protein
MMRRRIISKKKEESPMKNSYAEYFSTASSPKLKKRIYIKDLIVEEVEERNPIP